MIHRNLRDILRKHNKRIFILCIKSLCCADGSGLPRFSLWWLFPSHPNFASYDLVNLVHLPLLDMFSDESQCLWRFCCIIPRDFVRADFWVNCLRQLASFLLCVSADWLHTSKQARKAPKLTGKLLLGRDCAFSTQFCTQKKTIRRLIFWVAKAGKIGRIQQWHCVKSALLLSQGNLSKIIRSKFGKWPSWGNCILQPGSACNHTKLFRGSYSKCTAPPPAANVNNGRNWKSRIGF